jgi:hypothetical protein
MASRAPFSVTAAVVLPLDVPAGAGVLVLQVEDVGVVDVAARVLASGTWPVEIAGREPLGEFVLAGFLTEGGRHTLRATVDLDGDGQVGVGDLLSVVSVPVRAGEQRAEVPLIRVG